MYLDAGAPPEKVVLGLGFFGRSYLLQDPTNNGFGAPTLPSAFAGPYTKEEGFLGYNEVRLALVGWAWLWVRLGWVGLDWTGLIWDGLGIV